MSDYGTVLMVAWGMAFDERAEPPVELRIATRDEIAAHGMTLSRVSIKGQPNGRKKRDSLRFRLWGPMHQSGEARKLLRPLLTVGSMARCCRRALEEIDPENYPKGNTP